MSRQAVIGATGRPGGPPRPTARTEPSRLAPNWSASPALRRALRQAIPAIAGAGLGASVGLAITAETMGELRAPGGIASFIGNVAALSGTYLALVMVLLMSRIPLVERAIGQDGLARWHRRLAPWPLTLIALHAFATTIGYAQAQKTGFWHQVGSFVSTYPDLLAAIVGFGLMMGVGIVSIRAIRERLRRETWWAIHLYLYLALALSFAHEIALGQSFVGHPLTIAVWSLAWAATAGLVLAYRFTLPLLRSLRHRLRVVEVREEAPGVTSVICEGRHLDRLAASGGQFFMWRFLVKGLWWQAHPYSLSALPNPPYLRLTVKQVGDHSSAIAELAPGTRVAIEGPYGTFTPSARQRNEVVLIAAGIGVTALRSLLEDLPRSTRPIVVVRASSEQDLVFAQELRELTKLRSGKLYELVGRRDEVRLDRHHLERLVPDLSRRDAYVCGPEGFVRDVVAELVEAGMPNERIHHEAFSL